MKKINFMDVGARWGIGWPFSDLSHSELSIMLIEPDPEEAILLEDFYKRKNFEAKVFQTALWSRTDSLVLNLTRSPGCSSVFNPNMSMLNMFPESDRFSISKKIDIKTDTIDNLYLSGKIQQIDFLKIDVQGAELEILNGGKSFLKDNLIGIEVEVEFLEIYKGQPLFSEIDFFIRKELGLELWDLGKTYWKYNHRQRRRTPAKGKLAFGDALYFRPIEKIVEWLSNFETEFAKGKIEALIQTVLLYGYVDYACALLEDDKISKYFTNVEIGLIFDKIQKAGRGINFNFMGSGYIYLFFLTIANLFKPVDKDFATRSELQLGSKRKFYLWNY
jgi:FkbM family methyltransferase